MAFATLLKEEAISLRVGEDVVEPAAAVRVAGVEVVELRQAEPGSAQIDLNRSRVAG